MIKPIFLWPEPILSQSTKKVEVFDETVVNTIVDLLQTLESLGNQAIGLAAPQIGINLSVFVHNLTPEDNVLINPKIVSQENETIDTEGCMSFPGLVVKVKRPNKIKVEYQDIDGNIKELVAEGLLARCICHETDHLNGMVLIKDLSKLKRDFVTMKFKNYRKKLERKK